MTPPTTTPTLSLQCHPASPAGAALTLSVTVSVLPSGLQLDYVVEGDMATLRIPPATEPGPADGLWQHTCLEAFVAAEGDAAYREFNFSPSGQWATYSFASERLRTPQDTVPAPPPTRVVQPCAGQLTLTACLPWSVLPPRGTMLSMGLSAVMEEADGRLSYWALQHPCDRPDFHHPAGRALRLALPLS